MEGFNKYNLKAENLKLPPPGLVLVRAHTNSTQDMVGVLYSTVRSTVHRVLYNYSKVQDVACMMQHEVLVPRLIRHRHRFIVLTDAARPARKKNLSLHSLQSQHDQLQQTTHQNTNRRMEQAIEKGNEMVRSVPPKRRHESLRR